MYNPFQFDCQFLTSDGKFCGFSFDPHLCETLTIYRRFYHRAPSSSWLLKNLPHRTFVFSPSSIPSCSVFDFTDSFFLF